MARLGYNVRLAVSTHFDFGVRAAENDRIGVALQVQKRSSLHSGSLIGGAMLIAGSGKRGCGRGAGAADPVPFRRGLKPGIPVPAFL